MENLVVKEKLLKVVEKPQMSKKRKMNLKLLWAALAVILGKITDWNAQELKVVDRQNFKNEFKLKQEPTAINIADTITLDEALALQAQWEWDSIWTESEPELDSTDVLSPDDWIWEWSDEEKQITTSWMIQFWTSVAWDFAEICSDKGTLIAVVDISHEKIWLWFTAIRMDDFHNDPDQPTSKATVLNPHRTKTFKDGKVKFSIEWKYTLIDNLPKANWFSPDIIWSYSDKWWTIEWMYAHKFKEWQDSDAFRIAVWKKIWDALTLTAQWRYETWYDRHFYGRVIVDVELWNWFWVSMSCIAKYGKLMPTIWVLYKFKK